jgi:2-dehydropantoate 2-reductase
MKILMVGAGVIGSTYASRLQRARHDVTLLARGGRLEQLSEHGLVVENAQTGERDALPVRAIGAPDAGERFDLVWVAVQRPQIDSALPVVRAIPGEHDVVFFANTVGRTRELADAFADRCVFGFPGAGGLQHGHVTRYVFIRQQKTTLGEPTGARSERIHKLEALLTRADVPTTITANIEGWLLGHAAFIVPISLALSRVDGDTARLAADPNLLRQMVRATRQAFTALTATGAAEVPTNLRVLYRLPSAFAAGYWRRVMASPRGELWFGHTRDASQETDDVAGFLEGAVRSTGRSAPDLAALLVPLGGSNA